jgi:hypothetical protein
LLAHDPLSPRDVLLSRSCISRVCWPLLLAAMAITGAVQMRGRIAGLQPHRAGADATSEAILGSLTGEREVPRRLAAELARLPHARPVLILRPPGDVLTSLPAYMVAYEAMPRATLIREARLGDSAAAVEEMRRNFSAVVFVGQAPPAAFPAGRKFGGSLVFVPL